VPTTEPLATALLLALFGALLVVSVLFSRASERSSIPVALIFLVIGMLAGSEGIGGVAFENYAFSFRIGTVALTLILFDGGMNTPLASIREAIRPAGVLATLGVVGTAALVGAGAHALGLAWPLALLLGAIVSSTDAAAVFAVLRGSGVQLKRRVGTTLEVESGINDPMAVILTAAMTEHALTAGGVEPWRLALGVVVQLAVGGVLGVVAGWLGRMLLTRLVLPAGGLYPALTLGLACLAFSVPTLLFGSGFLAVYVAGVVIGNAQFPFRNGLLRVHDALAWLSQIVMFLVFGLLVFPSRLRGVAGTGVALALFLVVVARPLVVALCLAPFRAYRAREVGYIGWVGLRGAVPIVLAIAPVLAGVPGAERVFDIVFFIVVVNAFVPGATVPWVTRRFGLESRDPPAPPAVLQVESLVPLEGELLSFRVDEALAVSGARLRELEFPSGAAVVLIVRGRELLAPKGDTELTPGDHVYVITKAEDRGYIQLIFGRPEGE
jgi:cell volume regulation protein A